MWAPWLQVIAVPRFPTLAALAAEALCLRLVMQLDTISGAVRGGNVAAPGRAAASGAEGVHMVDGLGDGSAADASFHQLGKATRSKQVAPTGCGPAAASSTSRPSGSTEGTLDLGWRSYAPARHRRSFSQPPTCPICLETQEGPDAVLVHPATCRHELCLECAGRMCETLGRGASPVCCPLCRGVVGGWVAAASG